MEKQSSDNPVCPKCNSTNVAFEVSRDPLIKVLSCKRMDQSCRIVHSCLI